MATDCIAQLMFRFQRKSQPVVAAFDMAHASSDGGAVLLKAIDRRLGLTEPLGHVRDGVAGAGEGPAFDSGAAPPAGVRPGRHFNLPSSCKMEFRKAPSFQ